jgi:hypothetical protein
MTLPRGRAAVARRRGPTHRRGYHHISYRHGHPLVPFSDQLNPVCP